MRVLLLAGLAVAAVAQSEPPESEQPAPVPPVEITAPTRIWYDAERFDGVVVQVRDWVEIHSGLKFKQPPRVRAADDASWDRLIRREMPDARDHALAVAVTFGLYLSAAEGVVLSPFTVHAILTSETSPVAQRQQHVWGKATLAHELTHVLQEQHFGLPARMRAEDRFEQKFVLRALVEGFACVVEERVAVEELGLADYGVLSAKMHQRNRRMDYVRGRSFFLSLAADGGNEAMFAAMRDDPPTMVELVKVALKKPAPKKR